MLPSRVCAYPCLLVVCAPFAWTPTSRAQDHGLVSDTLAPTGQLLRPAGDLVQFEGRPVDLAASPDGATVYAKDDKGIVVLDAKAWTVRQELKFAKDGSSLHGIAVSADATRVYATNSKNILAVARVGKDGMLSWERSIHLPGPEGKDESFPCGFALIEHDRTALVCLSRNNSLGVVDLASGTLSAQIPVGVAPYDIVVSPDSSRAWVSNWGGRRPRDDERSAPSSGTPTLVDERGIAMSGTVSLIDLNTRTVVAEIQVGLQPFDLEMSRDGTRVYVANANSDSVNVIDASSSRVVETIDVKPDPALPFGSAPGALGWSSAGDLLVALGGNNAIGVVRVGSNDTPSVVRGFIPTGWYPGAIATSGESVFVCNIKGVGSRHAAQDATKRHVKWFRGSVGRFTIPDDPSLAQHTRAVKELAHVPQILAARERAAARLDARPVPIPERLGEPSTIDHVVYIIKENRTYDQVFGDMGRGNSEPSLCIFGREVTPNIHAIADQFVLLDNWYCNGVLSADGHAWATEGNVTGYLERSFGGFTRSYPFGDDPLSYSSSGFLWDHVLGAGLSFKNFGEMDEAQMIPKATYKEVYEDFLAVQAGAPSRFTFKHSIGIDRLRRYSGDVPGWNMNIPDVVRADLFLKWLASVENGAEGGSLPNLVILHLPNDHTEGTSAGAPTPRSYAADNDLALGRVIDRLSHTKWWARMAIFVIEDDPQDGFDHVDGHRSVCLVASPFAKRGQVVSEFYNQASVVHTIEQILGVRAENQMYARAPVMATCFTSEADLSPYTVRPNTVPLCELNPPKSALRGEALRWAEASESLDFQGVDQAEEETLNRVLWFAMKGEGAPYPAEFEGAHAKGLKALGLTLGQAPGNAPVKPDPAR